MSNPPEWHKALSPEAQRKRITELVIEPMLRRGLKPRKGAHVDTVSGDYVIACQLYPNDVIEKAVDEVLMAHNFGNWPMPGAFRDACRKYAVPDTPQAIGNDDSAVYIRSRDAWRYVERRMLVNDGGLLLRAIRELGPWGVNQLRKWLFAEACACIRAGGAPHIPEAAVEAKIAELRPEATAIRLGYPGAGAQHRKAGQAPKALTVPGNLGQQLAAAEARGDLERAPPAMSEDDYGETAATDDVMPV